MTPLIVLLGLAPPVPPLPREVPSRVHTPPPPPRRCNGLACCIRGDCDRSKPWPGYDWEPPRTLPDGPPVKGRADRLRALGNAVCPAQGALAIRTALREVTLDR